METLSRRLNFLLAAALFLVLENGPAGAALNLTIDDYVAKAIQQGVAGKKNEITFRQAGYTREIAFRQTDSPTVQFGHTHSRSENKLSQDGFTSDTLTDTKATSLTVAEPTPLGTNLSASGSWGDNGAATPSGALGSPAKPSFNASATQPLYLFVKNPVRRTRQLATLDYQDADSTFLQTKLSLRTQARGFYYAVMQSLESIRVQSRKKTSSQKLLDITQALVDAGKSAPVDTMRAKLRLQEDDRRYQDSVVQKEQAILNAKNFVFLPLDEDVQFVTELQFAPFRLPLERLKQYALLHRPLLETLRRAQVKARLNREAAQETTRPTFSLTADYGYGEFPNVVQHTWDWRGTINWLLFDSFVTSDKVQKARLDELVADLNLKDGERSTQVDVTKTYWDIKRYEKQIVEFQAQREQAARNVDVLRLRFQNGLDRIIDVFQAEDDMRTLDNEYLNLLVQFNQAKDQLSELLGVDVETLS